MYPLSFLQLMLSHFLFIMNYGNHYQFHVWKLCHLGNFIAVRNYYRCMWIDVIEASQISLTLNWHAIDTDVCGSTFIVQSANSLNTSSYFSSSHFIHVCNSTSFSAIISSLCAFILFSPAPMFHISAPCTIQYHSPLIQFRLIYILGFLFASLQPSSLISSFSLTLILASTLL